jgi:hypothetical protein
MQMKMLRHCCLLAVLLFAAGLGKAQAQSFAWAHLIRGAVDTTFVYTQASATDAAGNTYVAVSYKDSLRVGGVLLVGPRNLAAALLKYDATGAVQWAKALNYIQGIKLAADNNAGGVFLAAASTGGIPTWGGVALPVGNPSVFYAKCAADGTLQWANALPLSPYYNELSVGSDNAGNAYFGGTVVASGVVGGTAVAPNESYILKANGAGTAQWVRVLHTTNTATPIATFAVTGKPSGGCLVSGIVNNAGLYLGTGSATALLTARQVADGFLTTFDAAGTHQWSQFIGNTSSTGQSYARPYAAIVDGSGSCYVTGTTVGTISIGTTTTGGFYLIKYDDTGLLQWVNSSQQPLASAGTHLVVGNSGPTVMVQSYQPSTPLNIGTLALRSPCNVVHFNNQGVAQWVVADAWQNNATPYYASTGLGIDSQDNLYPVGRTSSIFDNFAVIQLGAQTTVGKGTIVSRINTYANTLRGQVYFDTNGNGVQDAGEGTFPRQLTGVLTQGSNTTYSAVGSTGQLQAYAEPGAYSLTLAQVPARYTITQPSGGSYSGTFSGNNQLVSGQNFGIAPLVNQNDVRIVLLPYSTARPGFTTRYHLTLENGGTTTVSGTATLVLDSRMTYVSSTPSASRTGQTLTWTYSNLAPFGRQEYDILFSLPTNAVLGASLTTTATAPLAGDLEPADNTATLAQTIVSSYDPNAIEVNYPRITPAQVAAGQMLEYTIHFQNLGTAEAYNVILNDALDYRRLDLRNLQWLSQSHNCIWSLTGTGQLTVRFLNINLPDRNTDVIRSQGFVRFRVPAKNTLAVGEIIPNQADIVFDYNAPVLTNTATTTVMLATAALARHEAAAWDAYPNPAKDVLTVSAELATAGRVQVALYDVLGRPVRQQAFTAPAGALRQVLDLRGLAAGVYVLRLTPPTGPATSRQVVRE